MEREPRKPLLTGRRRKYNCADLTRFISDRVLSSSSFVLCCGSFCEFDPRFMRRMLCVQSTIPQRKAKRDVFKSCLIPPIYRKRGLWMEVLC